MTTMCKGCGKVIERGVVCSSTCAGSLGVLGRTPTPLKCVECGAAFEGYASRMTCSAECKRRRTRRMQDRWRYPLSDEWRALDIKGSSCES